MEGSFKTEHVPKVLREENQNYSQANGLIEDGTTEEREVRQASVLHWRFVTERFDRIDTSQGFRSGLQSESLH
jgi:hypothetical protein